LILTLVVVNDAGAVYPVRIDPTFSDANWMSMGGVEGADGPVLAAVTLGSFNFSDILATNYPGRFYQAQMPP
jgi:hypothetical protein